MKSLYQISSEAQSLASALIEGELTPEMEKALAINQTELQEKAINYGYVVKSIEGDVSIIEEEIKRLTALKKAKNGVIDRMKQSVLDAMVIYGIEKVTSPTLNLAVRFNPESVDLVNEYQIPDCYKKEKVTVSIDKTLIKEDLKSGLEVPGAVLKRGTRLEIK